MMLAVVILLLAVVGYVVVTYNKMVSTKVRVNASIQEIGNQLKRQADLIPNLESSAQAYLKHEKSIFDKLTSARRAVETAVKSGDIAKMAQSADKVQELLKGLTVIMESNPQIKGAEVISQLMDELRDTSDKVMYSRRTLIDLTADYNTMLVTFPSKLVASVFGMTALPGFSTPSEGGHLEVSGEELKTPKVKLES